MKDFYGGFKNNAELDRPCEVRGILAYKSNLLSASETLWDQKRVQNMKKTSSRQIMGDFDKPLTSKTREIKYE